MKNRMFRITSFILVFALLISCSFAYFSDYATTQSKGTAGTVALSMDSNINLLDADGRDIINPGDMRDGSFTVTNEGNKSVDVRTTIVLTTQSNTGFDLAFSGDANTQSEYDLYLRDDVELVEGYGYMPKEGAKPLQVKSIDQDTITYILPEYSLNGNSDRYNEVETIDGVNEFAHTNDFVFVMKGGAGNEWQNSSVSIDVLVEAKQHENTQSGWDIVATENITSGAINKDAVKGENVITDPDGSYNGVITFALINDDTDAGIPNVTMTLVKLPEGTASTLDTLGGTVIKTVRSDANGEGEFGRLAEGAYALVSPNFQLTEEAKGLLIVGKDGRDHYEWRGSMDWAGAIEGTLKDENGDPVPDKEVSIDFGLGSLNVDFPADTVPSDITDENGKYNIYPLIEGDYQIKVEGEIVSGETNVTVGAGETVDNGDIVVAEPAEEPDEPSEAPEGVVVTVNYVYEPDATEPLYSENIDDNVSDIIAQLVAEYPEIEDTIPASWNHSTHGFGRFIPQGVMVANLAADTCPYNVYDGDPWSETTTYDWTSYEILSNTDKSIVVKFICDETDFSNMALGFECECGPGVAHGGVAIEDGKLTWTCTFDKDMKTVDVTVVDMNGNPVANAYINAQRVKDYEDMWGDCMCNPMPNITTDENGHAVLTGEHNTLTDGVYEIGLANVGQDREAAACVDWDDSFTINGNEPITITVDTPPVLKVKLVDTNGNQLKGEDYFVNFVNPNGGPKNRDFYLDEAGIAYVQLGALTYEMNNAWAGNVTGSYDEGSLSVGKVGSGVTVDGNKITMASGSASYEVELVVGMPNNVTFYVQDGTGMGRALILPTIELTGPNGYSNTFEGSDGFGEAFIEAGVLAEGLYEYTLTCKAGYECDYRMTYQTTGSFVVTGAPTQTVDIYENFDNPVGWQNAGGTKYVITDRIEVTSLADEYGTVYGTLPTGIEVYVSAVLDNGYTQISLVDGDIVPYINNNEFGMSIGYVPTSALADSI